MPHIYPQEAALRDGRPVLIRPFEQRDTQALWDFFQRLPEEVRRFAWDNINDRTLIETWGHNIDYGRVFPLLAFHGDRIVADATLHRRHGGPLRLVGRIKWLLEPKMRGLGLGTAMIAHLITAARHDGLRHLTCMLISDLEADAVTTLTDLGFESLVMPGYGADPDGAAHDMIKLWTKL
jgi:GNAT superfamily N-acetyltransferase